MTIPRGNTGRDKAQRKEILNEFYKNWCQSNAAKSVYNIHLREYIHVNKRTRTESIQYAAQDYLSTIMIVCHFDEILRHAVVIDYDDPKPNKSQKPYRRMLIMQHGIPFVGTAKLMVGIRKEDDKYMHYSLSAIK